MRIYSALFSSCRAEMLCIRYLRNFKDYFGHDTCNGLMLFSKHFWQFLFMRTRTYLDQLFATQITSILSIQFSWPNWRLCIFFFGNHEPADLQEILVVYRYRIPHIHKLIINRYDKYLLLRMCMQFYFLTLTIRKLSFPFILDILRTKSDLPTGGLWFHIIQIRTY